MRILFICDMHVGSIYGIAPKKYIRNIFQEWVLNYWNNTVLKLYNISYLVLGGDLIDGYSPKDTTSVWENDVDEQIKHAGKLLNPIIENNPDVKIAGIGGSKYHVSGGNRNSDKGVIDLLKGNFYKTYFPLNTPIGSIYFIHRSKNITTQLNELHLKNSKQNANIRMLVGGHLHRVKYAGDDFIKIIHSPCWEYPTDFMGFGTPVSIGYVIIDVENEIQEKIISTTIPIEIENQMQGNIGEITEAEIQKYNQKQHELLSKKTGVSINSIVKIENKIKKNNIPYKIHEPINLIIKKKEKVKSW